MKKRLSLLLITFSLSCFAGVPTGVQVTDLNVMYKDTQSTTMSVSAIASMYQQAQQAYTATQNSRNLLDAMNNISNIPIGQLCLSCSDYTVNELENFNQQMAKNWCQQVSNSLGMANTALQNGASTQAALGNLQSTLTSCMANPATCNVDPTQITNALMNANTQTMTSMNQTVQMTAAAAASQKQQDDVKAAIATQKLRGALNGTTNASPSDVNQ